MKKISVLLLLALVLLGCQMYNTKNAIIENKSDYDAIISVKNFKENEKKILSSSITVNAKKSLSLPLYNDGDISLMSISRNYINKVTDTHYQILNMSPVIFTVYNKIDEDRVILSDTNALFDSQILAKGAEIQINVFNSENIKPVAINHKGLVLQVKIQARTMVVTY